MTFKQWLTEYYADKDSLDGGGYESEYSGDLAGLEDAWNAGVKASNGDASLISIEFRSRFEGKEQPK